MEKRMRQHVNGILLLDKPVGLTSNGALQRVKRLFNAKKAGHTGSLDPIATGMLPICFGESTKFSQFLLESDKSYYVTAKLGEETNTGDSEGHVTVKKPVVDITLSKVAAVANRFIGNIMQVPPMFSAIKIDGKPLYELARQGIEIKREPRQITIFGIELDEVEGDQLTLRVDCSKGTYIRTLLEDMGRELGCGAHVIGLRRLSVEPYGKATMYTLKELEELVENFGIEKIKPYLLPVESAVNTFPSVTLSTSAVFYMRMGQPVRTNSPSGSTFVKLLGDDGRFLGIGEVVGDGRVKPVRLVV